MASLVEFMRAVGGASRAKRRPLSRGLPSVDQRSSTAAWMTIGLATVVLFVGIVLIVAGACVVGHTGIDAAHHHDRAAHHDQSSHEGATPSAWDSLCSSSCQAVSADVLTTLMLSVCVAAGVELVRQPTLGPLFVRPSVSLPLRAPPVLL